MKKNMKAIVWIVLIVVGFAAAYIYYNNQSDELNQQIIEEQENSGEEDKEKVLAPDFTLENTDGEQVSLSDYKGKVVVLNFWASWCGPCRSEMPDLYEANEELLKDEDVEMLLVNLTDGVRETKEKAQTYLNESNFNFNVVYDTEGEAASKYQIRSIPTTVIVDPDGYVKFYHTGPMTKENVLSLVEQFKNIEE